MWCRRFTSSTLSCALFMVLTIATIVIIAGCGGRSNTINETNVDGKNGTSVSTGSTIQSDSEKSGGDLMFITSKVFMNGERIPAKYANKGIPGGKNVSIPLEWSNTPDGTESFALSMIDISAKNWVHWLVVNIPSSTKEIPEGASNVVMPSGSQEINNTFGFKGYGGPQPPVGSGNHVYVTTIYALNVKSVKVSESASFDEFIQALNGRIIEKANIKGIFAYR